MDRKFLAHIKRVVLDLLTKFDVVNDYAKWLVTLILAARSVNLCVAV